MDFLKTHKSTAQEAETVDLPTNLKNIKVLVVEDIALNQLLMKTLLDDFGFTHEIAGNGKIAIEKLKENSFDLVLMDLQMPEMNGFEATEYIRNTLNLKIPVIALTADVTTVDLAKCKAVGMNDYLAKPIDEKLLYSKIISTIKKDFQLKKATNIEKSKIDNNKLKYVDLNYLAIRTKSNPALMKEMISLFLDQTPPIIKSMKEGLPNKNWELLKSSAHKMIPSFSIMGMSGECENIAKNIQDYARTEKNLDKLPNLVSELEKVCNHAYEELKNELLKPQYN